MRKWIRKVIDYIKFGVWQKDDGDFKNKRELWLTRQLRVLVYTIRGVGQHESFIRSAALTFYTLMSLVPILALVFGVIKGFGLDDQLNAYLLERYPQYTDMIGGIINFADEVLVRTRGGVVAISGLVILIWAAIRVFTNVENAFNTIWEVKKKRSVARKASAYVAVIVILPIIWVGFSGIVTYIQRIIVRYSFLPNAFLYTIGSLVVIWLIFTIVYKAIPYTKVKIKYAAMAGGIAAVAFLVFQAIYVYIQSGVSAYNIIYGSFAAIPLFLLWLQISWQIILLGAELSFSYQNIDSYKQEREAVNVSYDNRRKITLASLLVIIRNFAEEKGGLTSENIAQMLGLPLRLIRDVLYDLENAELIIATQSEESDKIRIFIPAKDIHSMTFYSALEAVETTGTDIEKTAESKDLKKVSRILDRIKKKVSDSEDNMPLMELLKR